MSSDVTNGSRGSIDRRTLLQYAGAAALVAAAGLPKTSFAASSKPYTPGVSTTET